MAHQVSCYLSFILLNRLELLFVWYNPKKSICLTSNPHFNDCFWVLKHLTWILGFSPPHTWYSAAECKYVFFFFSLAIRLVAIIYVISLLQELGSFMTESSSSTVGTLPLPGPHPVVCPRFLGWPFLHTIQCPNCRNSKRSWRRRRVWQVKLLSAPEKERKPVLWYHFQETLSLQVSPEIN